MAEKSFGVKEINLIGASGTPTIESPNNLNLNAVNVAISTNVSIGGTLTVTGNVSVGGTLTYEDVTNVDSVGLITARSGIKVSAGGSITIGTGVTFESNGQAAFVGVITASKFVGDGSSLSGISGGGGAAGLSTDAYGNTFGGHLAGNALTSGNDDNVIIGREAGEALNTGDDNVFIGAHAGEAATSLSQSVLIGYKAGSTGQTGSRNVIIGDMNFNSNNQDQLLSCTFVGYGAGSNQQDSYNEYNTFIGYGAGTYSGADYDIGIGRNAGSRSSGRFGIFIGDHAGNPYGNIGDMTGRYNVMMGRFAGYSYTSAADNTLVGDYVAPTLTTGSNNLVLGHAADVSGATVSNEITLGDTNITTFRIPGIGVTFTSTTGNSFSSDGQFVTSRWTVANNGASNYTFTGPGGLSAASNSTLYLARGQTYEFNMNASGHGFGIQTSSGGWNASNEYTTGITNAKAAVGVIKFEVPFSAPNTLYYACTAGHSGMVGSIVVYPSI